MTGGTAPFLAFLDPVAARIVPGTPVPVIRDTHTSTQIHALLKARTVVTPTAGFFSRLSRQGLKKASRPSRAPSGTTRSTTPVRSAGAEGPRTASKRRREDTTSFRKWQQVNELKH